MTKESSPFPIARKELEIRSPYDYFCLVSSNEWRVVNAIPLRRMLLQEQSGARNHLMSLRLSTGIIGELDCPSGDGGHVPKGSQEIVIGLGLGGIKALLELGALPCISCHSGNRLATLGPEIAAMLEKSIGNVIGRADNAKFLTENYDARKLDWSRILSLGIVPQRFYTRPNLSFDEVSTVRNIFEKHGVAVPAIGFYDRSREDRFYRYN